MNKSDDYDEEIFQWVITGLGSEGRARLYGEAVAANLIPRRRWWWVAYEVLSSEKFVEWEMQMAMMPAVIEAQPGWFMAGLLIGATMAVPFIVGERRNVHTLGGPKRRETDRR